MSIKVGEQRSFTFMAIFKRRKNQTVAELEEYYASKQTRTGMAWIMAAISLLITILVVSALFFGGRWIYRSLTDKTPELTVTTTENNGTDSRAEDFGKANNEPESDEYFPSVVSDEAASTNTPSSSNTSVSAPSTPTTNDDLPQTGAGENMFVLLFMVVIAGYIASIKRSASKLN